MAEDIQIGADTSQAVSSILNIAKAFEQAARSSGASQKAINTSLRSTERGVDSLLSNLARQTAARQQDVRAIGQQITAEQRLAAARAATAVTGVRENSSGRLINDATGRFASREDSAAYRANLDLRLRGIQTEMSLQERLGAIRRGQEVQAERAAARQFADARRLEESYKAQERMLSRVFGAQRGLIPAPADATRMQRFAHLLSQIPPATWAAGMSNAASAITNMSNSTRYAMYEVSRAATVAGAAFLTFGVASVTAAVAHERAFANVERTTQTSAQGYEVLRRQLEKMAMELPITYEEITKIATAAGQLGIEASGVATFTRTVAMMTATTNLSSDAAGNALARFRTFFAETKDSTPGMAVTEATFSNLASSILKVGVNSIATETGIVNVAVQIASMGDYAGLTANQVIGLSGALSSIGVAPELSRGTITRTFSLIGNAVSHGGVQLEKFAALAGISSQQFKQAWGTDEFANVFTRMMQGINKFGGDANLMLQQLGFNSVRDRPLLLRLAGAADTAGRSGGLLAQNLQDAYSGWVDNTEIAIQYNKIATTTSARLQVLGQSFEQLGASIGEDAGNALGELASWLTDVVRGFEEFARSPAGKVFGGIALAITGVLGGLLLLVGGAAAVAASIQAIGVAWTQAASKSTTAASRMALGFKIIGMASGIIGIVATLATVVGGFIATGNAARDAKNAIQDVGSLVAAMRQDADNGATGMAYLSRENSAAAAAAAETREQSALLSAALDGVGDSARGGAAGLGALKKAGTQVKGVVGSLAMDIAKEQFRSSPEAQNLFKRNLGDFFHNVVDVGDLEDLGLSIEGLDFDKIMAESLKKGGKGSGALVREQLSKQLDGLDLNETERKLREAAINIYAGRWNDVVPNQADAIQSEIDMVSALGGTAQKTYSDIAMGAEDATGAIQKLGEAEQKVVDSMAKGLTKFVDMGQLIDFTQQFAEIANSDDQSAAAADFEKSWTDAYGGAAFSLEQYLAVFSRGAQEQDAFLSNLHTLRDRLAGLGLSDAVITDLAAMGPESARLVEALITGTDEQLTQFEQMWGQTGYDSMVAMATQAALADGVVQEVFRQHGTKGLRALNDALSSGLGVEQALAQVQAIMNNAPLDPKTNPPKLENLTPDERRLWQQNNVLSAVANVRVRNLSGVDITGTDPAGRYATGGHVVGPGTGRSDSIPAWLSNGEFVMTAKATKNIGVGNLYAMMRAAQGGRSAPRGRGYANGGLVGNGGGGASGPNIVYLSPEDRRLIRSIQPYVRIGNRDIDQAQRDANFTNKRQGVG